jgi:TonB family protein
LFDEDRSESDRRELFLWRALSASVVLHSVIMTILILRGAFNPRPQPKTEEPPVQARSARVYMPRPDELRSLVPGMPRPAPKAVPVPPPPPRRADVPVPTTPPTPAVKPPTDRISVGPREAHAKDVLIDREIPKTLGGNSKPGADARGRDPATPMAAQSAQAGQPDQRGLPSVGRGDRPLADAGQPKPSISGSLHRLEQKWAEGGTGLGMGPTGPQEIEGLRYDPHGADFTDWLNHLRREVHRNWIVPEAARWGFRGRVTIRFVFARNGSLVTDEILEPSGTRSLDVAARDAVRAARLLPLPADYAPPEFDLVATFYYNVDPHQS